jgi:hypothetical protein
LPHFKKLTAYAPNAKRTTLSIAMVNLRIQCLFSTIVGIDSDYTRLETICYCADCIYSSVTVELGIPKKIILNKNDIA